MGLIPGSGRSPGEGHGNPLQHSCLENLMDRGAWQATVHRVAQIWTSLKRLSTHSYLSYTFFFHSFYFIFKLYNIVLVLPNIEMNPPQVYICSPS